MKLRPVRGAPAVHAVAEIDHGRPDPEHDDRSGDAKPQESTAHEPAGPLAGQRRGYDEPGDQEEEAHREEDRRHQQHAEQDIGGLRQGDLPMRLVGPCALVPGVADDPVRGDHRRDEQHLQVVEVRDAYQGWSGDRLHVGSFGRFAQDDRSRAAAAQPGSTRGLLSSFCGAASGSWRSHSAVGGSLAVIGVAQMH
jgi:hypothetical protein